MEPKLIDLFSRVLDLFEKGKKLQDEFKLENRPGKLQQLRLRYKNLKSQSESLRKKMEGKLISEIVNVEFIRDGKIYKGRFVNWTDQEVETYYSLLAKFENSNIKVTSISREPTFVSKGPI